MKNPESESRYSLVLSEDDPEVAYLYLRMNKHKDFVNLGKSIRLFDLVGEYGGPDVVLDFDAEGVLVGIELVG